MNSEAARLTGPGVALSIISVFGLAGFLLLFAAFWAGWFSRLQGIAVVGVAVLVFIAANGAAWASWGARFAGSPSDPGSFEGGAAPASQCAMKEEHP